MRLVRRIRDALHGFAERHLLIGMSWRLERAAARAVRRARQLAALARLRVRRPATHSHLASATRVPIHEAALPPPRDAVCLLDHDRAPPAAPVPTPDGARSDGAVMAA